MINIAIINTNNSNLVEKLTASNAFILDCRWWRSCEDPERNRTFPESLEKEFGKRYKHAQKLSPRSGERPSDWIERCGPVIERIVSVASEGKKVVLIHHSVKLLKLFAHFFDELGQKTVFFYEFNDGKSGECVTKQLPKEKYEEYLESLFPAWAALGQFSGCKSKKSKSLDAEAVFGDVA